MVHRYLFYLNGARIRTYRFTNGRFQLIKYKGEEFFTNFESFWQWWEEVTSYIKSDDLVDFCIIGNELADFAQPEYKTVKVSEWSTEKVKSFFDVCINEPTIELTCINNGKNKIVQISKTPQKYKYEQPLTFKYYTMPSKTIDQEKEGKAGESNSDKSILRAYFLEQLS
jgi:hypothetical protein